MELNEETWYIVKNTPKITGFVGGGMTPPPIPRIVEPTCAALFTLRHEMPKTAALKNPPGFAFCGQCGTRVARVAPRPRLLRSSARPM
jgi:hypothetical protein